MITTPSNLELLLHCYYSPEAHPRLNAPAIREGILFLHQNGMIEQTEVNIYGTTAKGEAYIKHLMKVPFPQAVWVCGDRT